MTPPEPRPYPQIDRALARRLDRAEGGGSARFVETRAALNPDSGAVWIDVAGAYAIYDAPPFTVDADLRARPVRSRRPR